MVDRWSSSSSARGRRPGARPRHVRRPPTSDCQAGPPRPRCPWTFVGLRAAGCCPSSPRDSDGPGASDARSPAAVATEPEGGRGHSRNVTGHQSVIGLQPAYGLANWPSLQASIEFEFVNHDS